jgi:hypothetical protein
MRDEEMAEKKTKQILVFTTGVAFGFAFTLPSKGDFNSAQS